MELQDGVASFILFICLFLGAHPRFYSFHIWSPLMESLDPWMIRSWMVLRCCYLIIKLRPFLTNKSLTDAKGISFILQAALCTLMTMQTKQLTFETVLAILTMISLESPTCQQTVVLSEPAETSVFGVRWERTKLSVVHISKAWQGERAYLSWYLQWMQLIRQIINWYLI